MYSIFIILHTYKFSRYVNFKDIAQIQCFHNDMYKDHQSFGFCKHPYYIYIAWLPTYQGYHALLQATFNQKPIFDVSEFPPKQMLGPYRTRFTQNGLKSVDSLNKATTTFEIMNHAIHMYV